MYLFYLQTICGHLHDFALLSKQEENKALITTRDTSIELDAKKSSEYFGKNYDTESFLSTTPRFEKHDIVLDVDDTDTDDTFMSNASLSSHVLHEKSYEHDTSLKSETSNLNKQEVDSEEDGSDNSIDEALDPHQTVTENRKLSAQILWQHEPCQKLKLLHASIRERYSTLLQQFYTPLPGLPDHLYFSTPLSAILVNVGDEERVRSKRTSSTLLRNDEITDEKYLSSDDDDQSIEFRSDYESSIYPVDIGSRMCSQASSSSTQRSEPSSYVSSQVNEKVVGADESPAPLFLHITCTIKFPSLEPITMPVTSLPTCLCQLLPSGFISSSLDVSQIRVSLDILSLSLPSALAKPTFQRPMPQAAKTMGTSRRRRISSNAVYRLSMCSNTNYNFSDDEDNLLFKEDEVLEEDDIEEDEPLNVLPLEQRVAINKMVQKIQWLVDDEVCCAKINELPLAEENVSRVVDHVTASKHEPNISLTSLPLKFVAQPEFACELFHSELATLQLLDGGYKLHQCGQYLVLVRGDKIRKKHVSSLLPPLSPRQLLDFSNEKTDSYEDDVSIHSNLMSNSFSPFRNSSDKYDPSVDSEMKLSGKSDYLYKDLDKDSCKASNVDNDRVFSSQDIVEEAVQSFDTENEISCSRIVGGSFDAQTMEPSALNDSFSLKRKRYHSWPCSDINRNLGRVGPRNSADSTEMHHAFCRHYARKYPDSENEPETEWLEEFTEALPCTPNFWIIVTNTKTCVNVHLLCRLETDVSKFWHVHTALVQSLAAMLHNVNQTVLLRTLYESRICDTLLEPESICEYTIYILY